MGFAIHIDLTVLYSVREGSHLLIQFGGDCLLRSSPFLHCIFHCPDTTQETLPSLAPLLVNTVLLTVRSSHSLLNLTPTTSETACVKVRLLNPVAQA